MMSRRNLIILFVSQYFILFCVRQTDTFILFPMLYFSFRFLVLKSYIFCCILAFCTVFQSILKQKEKIEFIFICLLTKIPNSHTATDVNCNTSVQTEICVLVLQMYVHDCTCVLIENIIAQSKLAFYFFLSTYPNHVFSTLLKHFTRNEIHRRHLPY